MRIYRIGDINSYSGCWLVVVLYSVFFREGVIETNVQSVTNISWRELKASSSTATDFVIFIYRQLGLLKLSWSFLSKKLLTGYPRRKNDFSNKKGVIK